jgi:hypothetical protein
MLLLFLAGTVDALSGTARNTLNQLAVEDAYRGRVMSLSSISNRGLSQLGNVQAGVLAGVAGPPAAMVIGGLIALGYTIWAAVRIPELRGQTMLSHPGSPTPEAASERAAV